MAMLSDTSTYFQQEQVKCVSQAARQYQIPALVLLAVVEQEGGKPGRKVRNRNGTFDYGVMQINTVFLADLRRYGIQEKHVLTKGCYPYYLAAWRIAGHLQHDTGDLWQRAANYHSKTAYLNRRYRNQLIRRARKIVSRLNGTNFNPINRDYSVNITDRQNQAKHDLERVAFTPRDQAWNAYSAPIRVKSFDALHFYPPQSTVTNLPRQTTFSLEP